MCILRSIAGAGRIQKLVELFREEHGDMFIFYGEGSPATAVGNFTKEEQNRVWFMGKYYPLNQLMAGLEPMILTHSSFGVYIYGNFSEGDVEKFKEWAVKFPTLNLVVTRKLPRVLKASPDGYGPFVIDEV